MAKRDPLETLRQMREFAVEARDLAAQGDRVALDDPKASHVLVSWACLP